MPSAARLRPWRGDDADDIAVMTADPHIRRWSSMGDDPVAWVQRQRSGARGPSRAICLPDNGRALGTIALRLPGHASPATTCEAVPASDRPAGELSYWLVPAARGRGVHQKPTPAPHNNSARSIPALKRGALSGGPGRPITPVRTAPSVHGLTRWAGPASAAVTFSGGG